MAETRVEQETTEKAEIIITPKAATEIKSIKAQNSVPDSYGLRVGVKGGGCSGFSYVLAFDSEPRQGDRILELSGVKVFIDPKSLLYLAGTELDYQDGLNGKGFVFNNPQATRTCGCGNSFAV
jgi:iron-sulfur cluster assembly protein